MGDIKIDISGFKNLTSKLKNIDTRQFGVNTVAELSNRVLREAIQNTTVDTGEMKRGWYVTPVTVAGNVFSTEVKNDAPHAGYEENGRRTRVRKDGSRGWVPGKFILLKATRKVERKAPSIIKARLSKHLK